MINYYIKIIFASILTLICQPSIKCQPIEPNIKRINQNDSPELLNLKSKVFFKKSDTFYISNSDIKLPQDTIVLKNFLFDEIANKFKNDSIRLVEIKILLFDNAIDSPVGLTSDFYYYFKKRNRKYLAYAVIYHDIDNRLIKLSINRHYDRD
jgi:hypothetical protein